MKAKSQSHEFADYWGEVQESKELKRIFYSEARRILGKGKEAEDLAKSAMTYFVLRYRQS